MPTLALSPRDLRRLPDHADLLTVDDYLALGVAECWLVDPERGEVRFWRPGEDGRFEDATPAAGQPFESRAIGGFRIDPATLLADPLPDPLDALLGLLG